MKLTDKLAAGVGFARARLLGHRVPVAVRINVNNRCHSRCEYCSFWHTKTNEMSAAEICQIIRDLAGLGTKRLSISGGEPMLRADLGVMIDTAIEHGISCELNSTGYLFRKRRTMIQNLELVKFSIDGSEAVHDDLRGRKGSFAELLDGIEVARELGIQFSFTFTMTKKNLGEVPFALDFAKKHGTFVAFQPVMAHEHASADANELLPDQAEYQKTIDWLIAQKLRAGPALRNSMTGLEHIRAWPNIGGLHCWAGEVFAMVEANGDVLPCDRIQYNEPIPNCRERGIEWALSRLPRVECNGCGFCGSVEINLLMAGRVDAVPGVLRVIRGGT
jgi:MoaA/NifB/PqqE/SkfB family radical SAM enzyme